MMAMPGPDLSKGTVNDRPWGATFASIAKAGRTGQLTVRASDGKVFMIAFEKGAVIGAVSPLTVDSVARVAVTDRLVTANRIAALSRTQRDDEFASFSQGTDLSADQLARLKRRVLSQRAARTFSVEAGEYEFSTDITIQLVDVDLDVRPIIYQGTRLCLAGERLEAGLRLFGTRFMLASEVTDAELAAFEFTEAEQPILEALHDGTSVPELEAARRDLDPRMAQAVLYALASYGTIVNAETGVAPMFEDTETAVRPPTNVPTPILEDPVVVWSAHASATQSVHDKATVPMPTIRSMSAETAQAPSVTMTLRHVADTAQPATTRRPTKSAVRSMTEPFLEARATTVRPNALSASETRNMIATRWDMVERGVDHFSVLGLPVGASVEAVREAYVELSRSLKPERLSELAIKDQDFRARTILAQASIAYTVLTEPERRASYVGGLRGTAGVDFKRLAQEAYVRGERALRADEMEVAVAELRTACELAPDEIEYVATLGKAEFRAASKRG
ncbi:MAG TPA: J domain-containing protein [Kofleriaceae bacterium]|nr:J domain-containing protein [Kofleriaceae bacterium]